MFQNYLKIAVRNLLSHKIFSFINIFGLAIGIACCVLLALFIKDEMSYETHFQSAGKIYRVTTSFISEDGTAEEFPRCSPPVAMTMAVEFPEVESATRIVSPPGVEQHLVRFEDKTFYERRVVLADSTFFDVFSFEFKEGDRRTAMDGRSTAVVSEVLARKVFGSQPALDHSLIINSGFSTDTFRITGVLKTPVKKSHLDNEVYLSMNSKGWGDYVNSVTTWAGQNFTEGYFKIKPGSNVQGVADKLPALLDKHGAKDLKEMGMRKKMHLQALLDIHLYSNFSKTFGTDDTDGSISAVYILGSIGLFILMIACINFMNLTTAKASQRAGEVGVRKSLGASRKNLIGQFLGESLTIVTIAMVLSVGIVQAVLPMFNDLTQKQLSINLDNLGYVSVSLILITLITGLIAGSYPAFFLSAFQPAQILKDKRLRGGGNWLRKSLVVFQFVISITLISSIIIIQKQMSFVQNQPLGFNPDYKIMIPMRTDEAKNKYGPLRDRIKQINGINEVSGATALPSTNVFNDMPVYPEGGNMEKAHLHFNINVDENYFKLLGIKLLQGRDFIAGKDTTSWNYIDKAPNRVIVNQASLKISGIDPRKALGQRLYFDWQGKHITMEIIGVVEDYHQTSLHQAISPLLYIMPAFSSDFSYTVVSVNATSYKNALAQVEKAWKEIIPNTPFENEFLTESVKKQYQKDERESFIITISTVLAILISCLGLYGLSIYVAERKMKEIGIRKVMGASVRGIVAMLSIDFIKLVFIAFVIAVPLGFLAMSWWLQRFEFKIEMNISVFLLAGLLSFAIAWITVGFESIRAALGNPVDSLRNE